ncbi:MAG: DNA-directed DNA polymerase [Candidatus Aenigmatarchaeota archaeon]
MEINIQILDVDYITVNEDPVVRIFGKTNDGKTVCGFYEGYRPYFYSDFDPKVLKIIDPEKESQVIGIERVERTFVMGYQQPKSFYKITLHNPSKTPELREKLKEAGIKTYEADILFKYRFMNDFGLNGLGWITVVGEPTKTNTVIADSCIKITEMRQVKIDGDAPLRYMAIDIECVPLKRGNVPDPSTDPVVIIALYFNPELKGKESLVLTTRPDGDVLSFDSESEMLNEFVKIVYEYDPDIITGYNINNFDIPYLLERMRRNKIPTILGRCNQKHVSAKKIMARQKIYITGRIVLDSYEIVKKDFSLVRYGLDYVAETLLNQKKEDVRHSEIEKLWGGNHDDFKRLVFYAKNDARLAMELVIKLNLIDKYVALSKVSGTLLQDTLDSGETTRIENFLIREFNKKGFILPCKPEPSDVGKREAAMGKELKGGYVLEPDKKLHSYVAVFDFKSMYPSIIRTYNICPTTILKGVEMENSIESPFGTKFAPKEVRSGIIPAILEELMERRQSVKKKLKGIKDAERKRLLNAEQWALKIMANAFYGHMGYARARIYDLDIANTITYSGRYIIQKTKRIIESEFRYDVVYGDTDSVFVKVKEEDMEEIRKIGENIAKYVTKNLPGVMELQFEKVFKRFLPLTKKRYMAWCFEPVADGWEEKIEMKGIETVRRDWCGLVSETTKNVIEIILKKDDTKAAVKYFRSVINDLLNRKIPVQKLIITKTMTKQPKTYLGMQPHIELVKKLQSRSPAEVPGIGDRIGYVIVKGTGLLSKRAEDPLYVMEKGLEPDAQYYIENQLLPPLERIFGVLGYSKSELLGNGKQMFIFDAIKKISTQEKTNEVPVSDVTGFTCLKCSRYYPRIPLVGFCECGGEIVFSTKNGNVENVVVN